jgi:hypothetical protein
MQPEARLVKKVQDYIGGVGGRSFKIHGEDTFQEVGIPDLLVCYKGYFVGLEVKQPGGRVSPRQHKVLQEIDTAGGISAVVSTLEQVVDLLAKLDRKR